MQYSMCMLIQPGLCPPQIEPPRLTMAFEKSSSESLCGFSESIYPTQCGYMMPPSSLLDMLEVVLGVKLETFQYRRQE